MKSIFRGTRKILIGILGFLVLVIGLILIPLPGPGLLVVILGLVILSTEYEWARHHKEKLKKRVNDVYDNVSKRSAKDTDRSGNNESKDKNGD